MSHRHRASTDPEPKPADLAFAAAFLLVVIGMFCVLCYSISLEFWHAVMRFIAREYPAF